MQVELIVLLLVFIATPCVAIIYGARIESFFTGRKGGR